MARRGGARRWKSTIETTPSLTTARWLGRNKPLQVKTDSSYTVARSYQRVTKSRWNGQSPSLLHFQLNHKLTSNTVPTEQSSAAVVADEAQAEVEPWLHTPMSPSPPPSPYPKIQVCLSAAPVQEAVPRADPAGPKKPTLKSTANETVHRLQRRTKAAALVEALLAAEAQVLVERKHPRQRLPRPLIIVRL
jgi:hypothetical protein